MSTNRPTTPLDDTTPVEPPPGDEASHPSQERARTIRILLAVAAAVVVVASMVLFAVMGGSEDEAAAPPTTADEATTGQEDPATDAEEPATTPPTATPAEPPAASAPEPGTDPAVDASTAVFPFAGGGTRFATPQAAVEAFAERVVGFVDPVYGELRQGDTRSGEVVVRPRAGGPGTTVLVRQLGDGNWWILGAASEVILLDQPTAGQTLSAPAVLRGRAHTFEGHVDVELWTDRADQPLAATFVTGGGDAMRPFEGRLTWDRRPDTRTGALYLRSRSAEDGSVWTATVVRVAL